MKLLSKSPLVTFVLCLFAIYYGARVLFPDGALISTPGLFAFGAVIVIGGILRSILSDTAKSARSVIANEIEGKDIPALATPTIVFNLVMMLLVVIAVIAVGYAYFRLWAN